MASLQKLARTGLFIALTIAADGRAAAQGTLRLAAPDPVADGLVAQALQNNVDVVRADAEVEAAESRISPARTLPDPSFGYNLQNEGYRWSVGDNESSFVGMMYTQALPFPGKLSLAGRIGVVLPRAHDLPELIRVRAVLRQNVVAQSPDRLRQIAGAAAGQRIRVFAACSGHRRQHFALDRLLLGSQPDR